MSQSICPLFRAIGGTLPPVWNQGWGPISMRMRNPVLWPIHADLGIRRRCSAEGRPTVTLAAGIRFLL